MLSPKVAGRIALLTVFGVLIGWIIYSQSNRNPLHRVGIIEPLQHVAVSDVTSGIREKVVKAFPDTGVEILVQNANRDATAMANIIAGYREKKVDVYVPIFTSTSQATKSQAGSSPIVFAAVTDPISAGLLRNPDHPEGTITGVSDLWPIEANFDLIRTILPDAHSVGLVFDPNDPSSAATLPFVEKAAEKFKFKLLKSPVTSPSEITTALYALGRVDLLFTANDVTVTAGFPALVGFAIERKVPLFAGDYSSVKRGAIAAVGQNYKEVGMQAGEIIVSLLNGAQVSSQPVRYLQSGDIYINLAAADKMGIALPDSIKKKASEIYQGITDQ